VQRILLAIVLASCQHRPLPNIVCLEDSRPAIPTCVCLPAEDALMLLERQDGIVIYGTSGQRIKILETWQQVRSCP
jgi:hypothetical protein